MSVATIQNDSAYGAVVQLGERLTCREEVRGSNPLGSTTRLRITTSLVNKMSIASLLSRYTLTAQAEGLSPKTVTNVKLAIGLFAGFLGGVRDVSEVTADDLRRFIVSAQRRNKWAGMAQAQTQKISDTTVYTYVKGIKSYWSWLTRESIIPDNPLARVPVPKLPKKLPRVLTETEIQSIYKAIKGNGRDMAIIQLLLDSGMRLGEITSLKLPDIDLATGIVRVYGKGRKERQTYVSPTTAQTLVHYIEHERPNSRSDQLFLTVDGYPLAADIIQKRLARIGKKAGLTQRLGPHKLRHTFATLSLKYGSNLEYVRRSLGHTRLSTTQVYLDVSDADTIAAHKKYSPVTNLNLKAARVRSLRKSHPLQEEIITHDGRHLVMVPPPSVEVVPYPPLIKKVGP